MKILLAYNLKKNDEDKPPDYFSECDSEETVNAIAGALRKRGHSVEMIDAEKSNLIKYFGANRVDMVFNIAEGLFGKLRESQVPALLDHLRVPYTGSGSFPLALALNKALTKKILKAEGIPTPNFQLFFSGSEEPSPELRFPLIVKPNREGSGKGINISSVVNNREDLLRKVREIIELYKQEALAEEFIQGRELTVGILEKGRIEILPILEIDFSGCLKSGEYFYSWRMKEFQGDYGLGLVPSFHCPARLDEKTSARVKETALKTHQALGCFDISRTDIRLSCDGTPFVLEINPLPGLNPRESNFSMMAYAAGLKYEELIDTILMSAVARRRAN